MEPLQPEIHPAGAPSPMRGAAPPPRPPSKLLPLLALFVAFWAPPAAWFGLAQPQVTSTSHPLIITKQHLSVVGRALRSFIDSHGKAPVNFNMLRAFARSEGMSFSSFDGYGQRFDYIRLDERHYMLRSFGADAAQNSLGGAPDAGIVSWGTRPDRSLTYKIPSGAPRIAYYPAALLEGTDSPDGVSHAKLFADGEGLTRHLVVRLKNRGEFFMVAPHDRVEEFFWLPASNKIVYTATGSFRHRDGLYLWDLDNDSVDNLTDLARGSLPISPAAHGGNLWLSLAGLSARGPTVYAFAGMRHDGTLDPTMFFDPDNLFAFDLSKKPRLAPEALRGLVFPPPFRRTLDLDQGLDVKGGTLAQQEWLKLSLSGNLEKILLNWHQFSERHSESPLFPYGLWLLSSVYGEGFELLSKLQSKDAEVLRTFGVEIARALINQELAPTYVKSLALFNHEQLMDGLVLPYGMAKLVIPTVVAPPTPPTAPTAPPAPTATPKGPTDGK